VHYDINTPEIEPESAEFEKNRGSLPWPVEKGEITNYFGRNPHPTLAGVFTNNNGIDIGTAKGANVRSVFNGKVTSVFVIPNAGKCVIVSHGAYRTVYANLAEVTVSKGQEVKTKQTLGKLLPNENGGLSEAHFEIWKVTSTDMEKQNPTLWLFR
jgi:murein DD-endopeptidase MepM/ murein hydrolase activator NlpD